MTGSNLLHARAAVTAQLDNHEKLLAPVRRDQAVREWLESIFVSCPHCGFLQPPQLHCCCCQTKKEVSLWHFIFCEDCLEETEGRNDGEHAARVGAAIVRAAEAL